MSGQFSLFNREISTDIPSATSSPGSESGATPSGGPASATISPAGPEAAPAARSQRREKGKRKTIRAIFGQTSFVSSKHEDLSASLGSRYRRLTASAGSTLYELTWTQRITPSGFSIPAQRGRGRRISASGSIGEQGWPTPCAQPANGSPEAFLDRKRRSVERGSEMGISLTDLGVVSQLAGW